MGGGTVSGLAQRQKVLLGIGVHRSGSRLLDPARVPEERGRGQMDHGLQLQVQGSRDVLLQDVAHERSALSPA